MKTSAIKMIGKAIPPILLLLAILIVWQAAKIWFDIPVYLLPSPGQVVAVAVGQFDKLFTATVITAAAAICGFLSSLLVGTFIAFGFSQSQVIRNSCYPYAIFLQTVPMIAIAPLIILWFGYGFGSVVIVSFIISLFPIITNATTGMLDIDAELLDLFRLNNATRRQILTKLRLPNAVPHIITGGKTSSGLAVIGAIVGEFFTGFGGERFGLGYLILHTTGQLKTAELFAVVAASTLLGITIFATVNLTGATILARWYDPAVERAN